VKPISSLSKKDIENVKVICFDVDGVIIRKGTEISEVKTSEGTTLTIKTSNLSDEMRDALIELKKYFFVAINSGRSSMYLTKVFSELLWDNIALISEMGVFSLLRGSLVQHEKFDDRTLTKMRNIFVGLQELEGKVKDFRAFEPKQFLITLHAYSEIPEVYEVLKKNDPEGEFYAIWNGEAFDIAPKRLNKGAALKNLTDFLNIDVSQAMAIANGPNDQSMIDVPGIGVTTEPKELKADFYTEKIQNLGGLELANKLIELCKT
jgi:hydroxymethylpyrimidine pyrophosphatase-like HAD family hydrolase